MATTVTDNPQSERYELHVDNELVGILEYRGRGERRALTHTEVFEGHEGEGLGSRLIQGALDDVRARGMRIVPVCPFVTHFLSEHPAEVDLVEEHMRAQFTRGPAS